MFGIGPFELIIVGVMLFVPVAVLIVVLALLLARRRSHRPFAMPRRCPHCQAPLPAGTSGCGECGWKDSAE